MGRYSVCPTDLVSVTIQEVSCHHYILTLHELMYVMHRPEKFIPENASYNYFVSSVRVRSEHCVGFLKGRFSSLRGLRIRINRRRHIRFAALWITTCIILHSFAMDHEFGVPVEQDEFFIEGMKIIEAERAQRVARKERQDQATSDRQTSRRREQELAAARGRRSELKRQLFEQRDIILDVHV
jgi:hypothetical protein